MRPVANYALPEYLRVTIGLPDGEPPLSRRAEGRACRLNRTLPACRRACAAAARRDAGRRRRRPDRRLVRAGAARGGAGRHRRRRRAQPGQSRHRPAISASSTARSRSTATGSPSSPTPTSCCWRRRWRSIRRLFAAMAGRLPAAHHRHRRRQHQAGRDRGGARGAGRRLRRASSPAIRSPAPSTRARAAAFATLYRERNVVLTPLPETDPAATATVAALWEACGARVRLLEPAAHDRVFAAVSHLPHLLAFGLVEAFAARPDAERHLRLRGERLPRLHADRGELARDVARHLARQPRRAAGRGRGLSRPARPPGGDGRRRRRRRRSRRVFARARKARRDWEARSGAAAGAVPADGPRES